MQDAQNIFELGNSVTVDPVTRKVVAIDGVQVVKHTAAMQAFADRALAEQGLAVALAAAAAAAAIAVEVAAKIDHPDN